MNDDVGSRLQIIRTLNGWSQRELAKRAGVTNSTISMIEQGRVSPSVSSLQKVLDGIPMSLADFFTLNLDTQTQVFYDAGELTEIARGDILYRLLAANRSDRAVSIKFATFHPGTDTGPDMLISEGEEGGIVVAGQIEATVAGEIRLLRPGDGYYLDSRMPHRFHNTGSEDCALVIATATDHQHLRATGVIT